LSGLPDTRRERTRRAAFGIGLALLLSAVPPTQGAMPSSPADRLLEVERDGQRFRVSARADMVADPLVAWHTLTDYERLPAFVPGVARTRVLSRTAGAVEERLTVEYTGELRLWLFSLPTQVWLDIRHSPPAEIMAKTANGLPGAGDGPPSSLRSFEGRYMLSTLEAGAAGAPRGRRDASARCELAQPLPPIVGALFGAGAVRYALREQFDAMVAEIERRSRARVPAQVGR
jgi:hypothetical protein